MRQWIPWLPEKLIKMCTYSFFLWLKVISSKYRLSPECWLPCLPHSGKVSKVWFDILSIVNLNYEFRTLIDQGFSIKVGSGESILFWKDVWCGENFLQERFPRIYGLSNQKSAKVGDLFGSDNLWNLTFRINLFVWEENLVLELKQELGRFSLIRGNRDVLRWKWESRGIFSVSSAYRKWETMFIDMTDDNSPLNLTWRNLCPFRVETFGWLAVQNMITTRDLW
ncbi:Ribonuclease H protein [Actinidia chinensis var. chinensis]|uniref:Ribonuclease H protein n=1 Tax=Actinidia chinensis var. chinensis TaxID=1590841 RepID=A0A2R6RYV2_ACTCC|nr:Ribonuclease H protein [Actinidia chinensis var. chinensis]